LGRHIGRYLAVDALLGADLLGEAAGAVKGRKNDRVEGILVSHVGVDRGGKMGKQRGSQLDCSSRT
jgi:hypothetical protein